MAPTPSFADPFTTSRCASATRWIRCLLSDSNHARTLQRRRRYPGRVAAGPAPQSLREAGRPALVPFARAYSGLTNQEIRQVDALIGKSTLEKFDPVRTVMPALMFELAFEGIQAGARHKSGIAVRFPRMLRWRTDKPLHAADTLAALQALCSRPA